MQFLLINGPNLNTLGKREPEIYGNQTLLDIVAKVTQRATELGATVIALQSNHEGTLIDFLQEHADAADGLIINPGALGHTSIGLRDAITFLSLPTVEVHISNVHAREPFRQQLVLSPVCRGVITGLGWRGYVYALEYLVALIREEGSKT